MFETCYLEHRLLGADIMELVQLRLCGQDEDHSGEDDNKQREEGVDLQQTIIIYPHDHCCTLASSEVSGYSVMFQQLFLHRPRQDGPKSSVWSLASISLFSSS